MSPEKTATINPDEQIKNRSDKVSSFYEQLKLFVEKDEFDIFKTKKKRQLNILISKSQKDIENLLMLKTEGKKALDKTIASIKTLVKKNTDLKLKLIKDLEI